MRMVAPLYYTADMVRALPDDGKRYETVHGELFVTPAPRAWHQEIVFRIGESVRAYLREERVGHQFNSPADISWAPDVLVQPDVFVVPLDHARTMDWRAMQTLLLAVEVLSPSTTRADRFAKRRLYQEARVPLYWIVDADAEAIEVWTPEALFPQTEHEAVEWHPAGAARPFHVELAELFRPI